MSIPPYPLQWPDMMPRTKNKAKSMFKTGIDAAMNNVSASIFAFGKDSGKPVQNLVISSNVTLGVKAPADAGVAVWFLWEGQQVCIAVDRYERVQCNLQAIHHIIEARRTELRHGGLSIVRQTFQGFKALPAPVGDRWQDVLGLTEPGKAYTLADVEAAYRAAAKKAHPDAGGSAAQFQKLQDAYQRAKAAVT